MRWNYYKNWTQSASTANKWTDYKNFASIGSVTNLLLRVDKCFKMHKRQSPFIEETEKWTACRDPERTAEKEEQKTITDLFPKNKIIAEQCINHCKRIEETEKTNSHIQLVKRVVWFLVDYLNITCHLLTQKSLFINSAISKLQRDQ